MNSGIYTQDLKFPTLNGRSLEGKEFRIPLDLEGDLNLLLVAFKRSQQISINSWSSFIHDLKKTYFFIKSYELPVLSMGYLIMRFMIDGGMKAGIPYRDVREHTITLYLKKSKFMKKLQIETDDQISLFLINKVGDILWRTTGSYNEFKGSNLRAFLKSFY